MAIFPQGLTHVDQRCNAGERRVLHQLKRCLDDDHLVWHDVPIGPRARQPDFVVLSPRQGVLLLEVKDWRRGTLVAATRDRVELATPRGRVTEAHPLRQARDVALELVDVMKADAGLVHGDGPFRGKLLFPWGFGVVFSRLTAAEVAGTDFAELFPPHQVLLRDDLDAGVDAGAFQRRLWGMFTVSYPHTLTLPERDRIRAHLFPELRLPAQRGLFGEPAEAAGDAAGRGAGAGTKPPLLPDLMQVMDLQQEQIARTLGMGHRVIHGAAGSGKTMILIHRAQHLAAAASPGRPVLVLCFNRALADRIAALLRERGVDERVQVRTFHSWCQDVVSSYQLHVPPAPGRGEWYEALVRTVERALATGFVPGGQYTALLVDEAHDFEDTWLRMAVRLVDPATNSLLVLYDDAQSIYQKKRRRFNFASVGIEARGRTSILRVNYRNTAEVLALAMHCAQGLLDGGAPCGHDAGDAGADADAAAGGEQGGESGGDEGGITLVRPASAGRRGGMPVLIEAGGEREEAELVAERIVRALAGGRAAGEIAVLCRARFLMKPLEAALRRRGVAFQSMNAEAFRRFDWQRQSVKLLTLHSAKGLEFPLVFVAGLQAMPMGAASPDDEVRLLYVAMTRATHELVLSAHGDSPFVRRVRAALGEVAHGFAAAA